MTKSHSLSVLLLAILFMGASAQDVADLNQRAKQALENGQAADAVLYLESAAALKPDDSVLARNLGYAYFKRGQAHYDAFAWEAALGDYRRAIVKVPDEVGYRLHLASLALRLYRLDEALSASRSAVKADPENALAHQLLGDTLNLLDELPQAQVAYRKAQELGDDELAARAAKALARTGRQYAVEKDYRTDVTSTFVIRHPGDTEFLELAELLDRARAEVCNTFDEFPRNKAIVVLYPPEAFRAVTGAHDWVGGLFDRKIRLPVADPKLDGERIEASFRHEYTHLIMSELSPRCPVYLNEGLAQLAEYGRGQGISRLVEYMEKSGIARQDLPRIEDLPESFLELGDSGQVHLGYLLSFAFVDHVVSQHGMGAAIRWVRALEGQSPAEAYQKAIGRTLQHEETLFRELVRTARG
jgi:tetratricopeptide (TPR) repeat protein